MEENPKLELASSSSSYYGCGDHHGFEMEQKRMSASDNVNSCSCSSSSYQYTTEKAESYVIDMDAFSSSINKDSSNPNSRTTRSLSRKGSQRVGDRKINGLTTLQIHDNKDILSAMCTPIATMSAPCTPMLPTAMAVVSADHSINPHVHQQSNIGGTTTTATTEGRSLTRRNSFIRSSSWTLDPKRVLIFFATLSSMGTMLLIYFVIVSNKQNADEYVGDIGISTTLSQTQYLLPSLTAHIHAVRESTSHISNLKSMTAGNPLTAPMHEVNDCRESRFLCITIS